MSFSRVLGPCLGLLLAASCVEQEVIPGDLIGRFDFTAQQAEPTFTDCTVTEIPDGGFAFNGTYSWKADAGQAWFTFNGVSRDAVFLEGQQYIASTRSAQRRFESCGLGCEEVTIEETLAVALLSESQDRALGLTCPSRPLDGGVPRPDDAGIEPPGLKPSGATFDAVRACGELIDVLKPPAGCACGCTMRYRVEGIRR